MRAFRPGLLGVFALWLGCGPPVVLRPTPKTVLGRCISLEYTPHPSSIEGWVPPDTVRLLSRLWLPETSDTTGINQGELSLGMDENEEHYARWWLQPGLLKLGFWTPLGRRDIYFGRLSEFGTPAALVSGQWHQNPLQAGTVTGRFIPCPASGAG